MAKAKVSKKPAPSKKAAKPVAKVKSAAKSAAKSKAKPKTAAKGKVKSSGSAKSKATAKLKSAMKLKSATKPKSASKSKPTASASSKTPAAKSNAKPTSAKPTAWADLLTPLDDRVLVHIENPTERVTAGGLFIPDTAQVEGNNRGIVVSVGPGHRDAKGRFRPIELKVGDQVLFAQFSGTEIELENQNFKILRETDVLGTVTKSAVTK